MPGKSNLKVIAVLGLTLATVFASGACADSHEPTAPVVATMTLVSGGNQTVSLAASPNARLPEPVVVSVEEDGEPVVFGGVRAYIRMDGAPGANGAYYSLTDSDGKATMVLDASRFAAGFNLTIEYYKCTGFFSCTTSETLATVTTRGTVVP